MMFDVNEFLKQEVKPALGCTEPCAVALATASAASLLRERDIKEVYLELSANVFKNGLSVGLPGLVGCRGNALAAAIGAFGGDPQKGLMILDGISTDLIKKAKSFVKAGNVKQKVVFDVPLVYVKATIYSKTGDTAEAVIYGKHDNVVRLVLNDKVLRELKNDKSCDNRDTDFYEQIKKLDMKDLWEMAGSISDKTAEFLIEGFYMNVRASYEGVSKPWGIGVGYRLNRMLEEKALDDEKTTYFRIKALCGAASDVRMSGGLFPIMSSAGSGNHGITAILPPSIVAKNIKVSERKMAEALALSHLVTGYIKAYTGRLTPVCGCAVAAGCGAAAGIVYVLGGTPLQAEYAVSILASSLVGMACDGAKESCALKVSTAAGEAYFSALLALGYDKISLPHQGIIDFKFKDVAFAMGRLSHDGMKDTDRVILEVMDMLHKGNQIAQ